MLSVLLRVSKIKKCWMKPLVGWMKLNSDRIALGNPRRAKGGGGVKYAIMLEIGCRVMLEGLATLVASWQSCGC